jgi:hypothetical protein
MKKASVKQVMSRAWQIRKASAAQFGVKASDILFSPCLIQAWQEEKMEMEMELLRIQGKISVCRELEEMGFQKEKFGGYYSYVKVMPRDEVIDVIEMLDDRYGCRQASQFGRTPIWWSACPESTQKNKTHKGITVFE